MNPLASVTKTDQEHQNCANIIRLNVIGPPCNRREADLSDGVVNKNMANKSSDVNAVVEKLRVEKSIDDKLTL